MLRRPLLHALLAALAALPLTLVVGLTAPSPALPAVRRAGAHHAARRLDHRLPRLLAGAALEPPAAAPATPTSTSSAPCSPQGCGSPYDGDNEGHGGCAGHQRRRPEPAARLAVRRPGPTSC